MEIHNDISGVNLRRAHAELDHYYKIETSDIQKRIHENDGMTIKIIQDGFLDNIINTFDRRRIVLEKKADILSEYYGDSLRTKDLIKDYYSYKRVISGAANLTSAGILFANIYTKFAKNSVFFGALGTIASITAAQCLGRYLTNNWLERHVERNWKIHTTRMSKGLGPTNTPDNEGKDKETTSLRFGRGFISTEDIFGMPDLKATDGWIYNKINPSKQHFPFLLDSEHRDQFDGKDLYIPDRLERQKYKNTEGMEKCTILDVLEPLTGIKAGDVINYHKSYEMWKEAMNGAWTNWGPNRVMKKSAFDVTDPIQLRNDRIVFPNEYTFQPLFAEIFPDAPAYTRDLFHPVNVTKEIAYTFDCHLKTRMLFREYKKQLAEDNFWKGENKVLDFDLTEFNKFLEEREKQDRLNLINVIDFAIPDEEKNYYNLGTKSEKYVKYYYNLFVKRFRPTMIKETPQEFEYDFDFEIDEKNYDPWKEYKMIYRDVLTKGRAYWIIKTIPEWYFLQVGKPNTERMSNISRYNPKRPDMEDSIFHFITQERYFDERDRKMNLYNGYSQSIRV